MNDLDRELKDLFETKARNVDASLAAPRAVLRRGRRRQIGIVAGGALGGVAAIVIAGSLALALLGDGNDEVPTNQTPNGPYGDRTAIIGGFEVQAPEGWTLIDQWAWATVMASRSETCFASVGVEVGDAGQTVGAEAAQATGAGSGCTTQTDALPAPAILPVLQLSTFDPGVASPVCDVFDEGTKGTLPADGVAVFVAALTEAQTPEEVQAALTAACAATPDITSIVLGSPLTYVTATFAGANADPTLLTAAPGHVMDLGGHDTRDPEPSPLSGPAYVIGSGVTGDERWQISAGVDFSEGNPTAWMTSYGADGTVTGFLQQPWRNTGAPTASALDVGDASVMIGMIPYPGGDATWMTGDGTSVGLAQAPFPGWVSDMARPRFDGNVAYGEVPTTDGQLLVEGVVEIPETPTPPPSALPEPIQIRSTVREGVTEGALQAFGRTIRVTVGTDGAVQVSGSDTAYIVTGYSTAHIDLDGGTLLVARRDEAAVGPIVMSDDGQTFVGDWMAVPAAGGDPAGNLWIVPLPGTGSGLQLEETGLPTALSWPTHEIPQAGDVPSAGSTKDLTSWALRWTADDCPVLEVVDTADGLPSPSTSEGCIAPWDPAADDVSAGITFVSDEAFATIAVIGPTGFTLDPISAKDQPFTVQCGTTFAAPGWENTGVCIISMANPIDVPLQAHHEDGSSIGGPLGITFEDTGLSFSQMSSSGA